MNPRSGLTKLAVCALGCCLAGIGYFGLAGQAEQSPISNELTVSRRGELSTSLRYSYLSKDRSEPVDYTINELAAILTKDLDSPDLRDRCASDLKNCLESALVKWYSTTTYAYLQAAKAASADFRLEAVADNSGSEAFSEFPAELKSGGLIPVDYLLSNQRPNPSFVEWSAHKQTLVGAPFASRDLMVRPFFAAMTVHAQQGQQVFGVDRDLLALEKFSGGRRLYRAEFIASKPGGEVDSATLLHPYQPEVLTEGDKSQFIIAGTSILQKGVIEVFTFDQAMADRLAAPQPKPIEITPDLKRFFHGFREKALRLDELAFQKAR